MAYRSLKGIGEMLREGFSWARNSMSLSIRGSRAVILLDWSGVDLTPKSTLYAKKLVGFQDSNTAPDQIYTINSKSWQRLGV